MNKAKELRTAIREYVEALIEVHEADFHQSYHDGHAKKEAVAQNARRMEQVRAAQLEAAIMVITGEQ